MLLGGTVLKVLTFPTHICPIHVLSQFYADIKSEHKTDYMDRARDRTKIIITTQSQRFGDLNKVIDI